MRLSELLLLVLVLLVYADYRRQQKMRVAQQPLPSPPVIIGSFPLPIESINGLPFARSVIAVSSQAENGYWPLTVDRQPFAWPFPLSNYLKSLGHCRRLMAKAGQRLSHSRSRNN